MEQRQAAGAVVRRRRPWPDRHAPVRHEWVVPASSEQVRRALTGAPRDATALTLSGDEAPGTLTATSRRWRGTWRDGRHEGAADVELTRLSPHATLVELSLWPATGGMAPLSGRRSRDRVATGIARHLGVGRTSARAAVEPAVIRLMSPRPAGLPVVVWVALVALLFTPAVWAFVAAQGPTPITEERALAEHRERVQQLTSAREHAAADAGDEAGNDDSPETEVEPTDEQRAPSRDEEPADEPGDATPDQDARQAADTGADETAPAEDETAPPEQRPSDEGPRGPEEGVYQYATDGGEGVAVPNGSRDYPERTTISVTEDGCGYVERWSVLDERWDERETCTGDEAGLASQTSFREFFGVEREHTFVCDEQRPRGAAAQEPGTSWEITCEAEDARMEGTIEVVGLVVLEVGGTAVRTVHLRLDGEVSGDLEGHQQTDRWLASDHGGLLIREESKTRARVSSPMGEVDYREEYRIDLLSLRPRS
jgi:hypothetical protein